MSLHLVIGQTECLHYSIEELVAAAIRGGITHVQLREKMASTREFIATGQRLQCVLKTSGIPLIINDRVDIALALDADGVHLGQSDMPYPKARRLLGCHKIIGLTIETLAQMQQANQWDVQYIGAGPIFPTQTKRDTPNPIGISGLATLCKMSKHPVIAIGGIHPGNAQAVLNTGVHGIAVVSAIGHACHPEQASHALKQIYLTHLNSSRNLKSKWNK